MELFGKKKEKPVTTCDCGGNCGSGNSAPATTECSFGTEGAAVKILGSGCKKCNELEANTVAALVKLGMDTTVNHVTDFAEIAAYGVMSTPALVVNGKVVAFGKVLKTDEVVKLLEKVQK